MRRHPFAIGLVAAAAYLAVAAASFEGGLVPVRPLYDGTVPPAPYRWVDPPPDLASTNLPPASGQGTVELRRDGSEAATIPTDDSQAVLIFAPDAIEPRPGEDAVEVTITPLDPDKVGAPPEGLEYDSNAYRFDAVYASSGEPAELAKPASVVLRYAFGATGMYRRDGESWSELGVTPSSAALQVFADTEELGVFVAVGPPITQQHDGRLRDIVVAGLGLAVVVAGVVLGRWRGKEKRRAARRRAMGKKAKKPRPKP